MSDRVTEFMDNMLTAGALAEIFTGMRNLNVECAQKLLNVVTSPENKEQHDDFLRLAEINPEEAQRHNAATVVIIFAAIEVQKIYGVKQ